MPEGPLGVRTLGERWRKKSMGGALPEVANLCFQALLL